jgi:putative oxidoreductase
MDTALLVLRIVVGLYLIGHGGTKLFGWFGSGGLSTTTRHFRAIGFRPAALWALAAGLTETGGGLLFALGLLSPFGNLAIVAAMIVAIVTVHLGKGWFATSGGPELPLAYLAVAAAVAVSGPGRYSLDSLLGISLPEPVTGLVLAALTLIGVAVSLLVRRRPDAVAAESRPSAA